MTDVLEILVLVIFVYVVVYNLATLTLLSLSLSETSAVARVRRARVAIGPRTPPPLQPSVTVVVPRAQRGARDRRERRFHPRGDVRAVAGAVLGADGAAPEAATLTLPR